MSIASNIGASTAASEIRLLIEQEIATLKKIDAEHAKEASTFSGGRSNILGITALENVLRKCNEIIESADSGWY